MCSFNARGCSSSIAFILRARPRMHTSRSTASSRPSSRRFCASLATTMSDHWDLRSNHPRGPVGLWRTRESRRAFGACIPVHIYTQLRPPKIPKTRNTTNHRRKKQFVLPILKQVPRIESAPKNACLATCDRQIANSTSDQINNIIKTKTKKIKQRPSPPQPSSSPPPPPPSPQPTSATWPTAPPSPSLHT